MPVNRIISYHHPDTLKLADEIARTIAATGNAPADTMMDDYLKEVGLMLVAPLLWSVVTEIRALRADIAQIEHDRRMRTPTT